MAIPKKKSRLITVDGVQYRWRISFSEDAPFYRIVTIAAEAATAPGSKLIVYPIGVNVNYVDDDHGEPFTPRTIAHFIHEARRAGWQPLEKSPTFVLGDRSDDEFMNRPCPGFTCTVTTVEWVVKAPRKRGRH